MRQQETRALELVASALSDEYGVRVIATGSRVLTSRDANNLPVIYIPAIPLDNENYRMLIRGYVDHAVGHVRFGEDDFLAEGVLDQLEISGALKAVAAIFEDVRIDRSMGECFFGCGRNLRKLALHLYDKPEIPNAANLAEQFATGKMPPKQMPWHIWQTALQFIIYYSRSFYLPQLAPWRDQWAENIAILAPGLSEKLLPILKRVPEQGTTAQASLALATEAVHVIRDWLYARCEDESAPWQEDCLKELPWLLRNGGELRELADIGALAASRLDKLVNELADESQIALEAQWHKIGSTVWQARLLPLNENEQREALQAAAKMSAQMQALLQNYVLNREGPFRQGKLHTRNLHKLFIGRDDIFERRNEKRELNTEIVCCIDMSGSMRFDAKAETASAALYAVADSLARIAGLKLNIIGFFDNNIIEMHISPAPLGNKMKIVPDGGTMCGVAIRAASRLFSHEARKRKIIIIITDGDANDPEYFQEAIEDLTKAGIEIMGIGIHDDHILEYLPAHQARVINNLDALSEAILTMLRKKICIKN